MNSKHTSVLRAACVLCLLSITTALSGCGGADESYQRAAVHGMVTIDGEELRQGVILFAPTDGTSGPKTSLQITNGTFDIESEFGPPVGQHRIEIRSTDTGGYAMDDEQALKKLHESGINKLDVQTVPAAYNKSSNLVEEITLNGPNELVFELKSKKNK